MTITLFGLLALVAITAFALGVYLANRKWFRILDKVNSHYAEQLARILAAPIYIANDQPVPGGDGPCPDCGEYHDEDEPLPSDDEDSGNGVN